METLIRICKLRGHIDCTLCATRARCVLEDPGLAVVTPPDLAQQIDARNLQVASSRQPAPNPVNYGRPSAKLATHRIA